MTITGAAHAGAGGNLRLFVAVAMPEALREGLASLRRDWAGRFASRLGWVRPENAHLTLAFLGATPGASLPAITGALGTVRAAAFTLGWGRAGFFPQPAGQAAPVAPRVVWLGLGEGAEAVHDLAGAVRGALDGALGGKAACDAKPLRPHLTLARVKQARREDAAQWLDFAADAAARNWPVIRVTAFVLYASRTRPEGPEYTALARFGLG